MAWRSSLLCQDEWWPACREQTIILMLPGAPRLWMYGSAVNMSWPAAAHTHLPAWSSGLPTAAQEQWGEVEKEKQPLIIRFPLFLNWKCGESFTNNFIMIIVCFSVARTLFLLICLWICTRNRCYHIKLQQHAHLNIRHSGWKRAMIIIIQQLDAFFQSLLQRKEKETKMTQIE